MVTSIYNTRHVRIGILILYNVFLNTFFSVHTCALAGVAQWARVFNHCVLRALDFFKLPTINLGLSGWPCGTQWYYLLLTRAGFACGATSPMGLKHAPQRLITIFNLSWRPNKFNLHSPSHLYKDSPGRPWQQPLRTIIHNSEHWYLR